MSIQQQQSPRQLLCYMAGGKGQINNNKCIRDWFVSPTLNKNTNIHFRWKNMRKQSEESLAEVFIDIVLSNHLTHGQITDLPSIHFVWREISLRAKMALPLLQNILRLKCRSGNIL